MKKIIGIAAIAAAVASPAAFAQSAAAAFSGFDLSAGINHSSNTVSAGLGVDDAPVGVGLNGLGRNSTNGVIAANYLFPMNPNWVMGVGASYTLGKQKAAGANVLYGPVDLAGSLKYKNAWGIHVMPGYAVDKNVLLYAKLSYNWMKGVASGSITGQDCEEGLCSPEPLSGSISSKFKGWGIGFGARVNLNKNLFIDGSVEQINYKRKSYPLFEADGGDQGPDADVTLSIKPKSLSGKIMLGYRF